jgi:hypothetical protein
MNNNEKKRRQHIVKWNQRQNTNLNATKDKEQGIARIVWL